MTNNMNLSAKEQKRLEKMMKKAARPFYKKKRFIIPAGILVLIIMLNAGGGNKPAQTSAPAPTTQAAPKATIAAPAAASAKAAEPENKPGISKAEFNQIKNGMSYEQVKAIIGSEGEMLSEVGEKGKQFYTVTYQWDGESGFGSNANFTFQEGKLQMKAQFGLQ